MSPAVAARPEADEARLETTVDADPATRAFYRMLDSAFGESWRPNDDVRYCAELNFRPVDVIAAVDQHEALYQKASEIETRMRREFGARVLIFVIDENFNAI